MHPVGIALGFLVFWSLVAAGVFLTAASGSRLRVLAGRRLTGGVAHLTAAESVAVALHVLTLLVGATLVVAGLYATYVVVLAR